MNDLLHFLFVDHAIFRALWSNTHIVAPGIYRSNHPTFRRLKKISGIGVKHILSLRGDVENSNYHFEIANCKKLGLEFSMIGLASRDVAPRARFIMLLDFFDTIDVPFLMHCKSGADRTSLAAAFYLIYKCGAPIDVARKQMSWRYLHFKWTKTGILDFILDQYAEFLNKNPDKNLRDWVENVYDPVEIKQAYNTIRLQSGKSPIK